MISRRIRFLITLTRHNSSFTPKRIDTVPSFLHAHLFGTPTPSTSVENEEVSNLKLPKLHGENLESHFRSIANQQVAAYKQLLESVEGWVDLPIRPDTWVKKEGWTRYGRDGKETEEVPYPLEDVFLYDVETCVVEGQLPTLAIALSDHSWYSWCSPRLADPDTVAVPTFPDQKYLIPLGGESKSRIAIGHNVAYDRVRAREPYDRKKSHLRFWDTMSMSIPLIGMADHQMLLYESNDIGVGEGERWRDSWKKKVSRNSLAAVHKFFYGRQDVDKAMQKFFVNEPMSRIVDEFQVLTTYCANDVLLTLQIYQKLAPLYREHFPHPATMAGVLHMSEAYLPINQYWRMFFEKSEVGVAEQSRSAISAVVEAARDRLKNHDVSSPDTFMWAEKWSRKSAKTDIPSWVVDLFSDASTALSVKEGNYDVEKVIGGVKMKSNIIPRLFGLCYGPYPLHHRAEHGWGFLVPNKVAAKEEIKLHLKNKETVVFPSKQIRELVDSQSREFGNPVLLEEHEKRKVKGDIGDCAFYQLPHPNGKGNVGYPIGKDFMGDIEEKVIRATRHPEFFDAYVQSIQTTSFWKSFRERYSDELPIWYDGEKGGEDTALNRENTVVSMQGAIAPAICPAGTVSRRSVHKLWVTATNANEGPRIGTGLKSMVQAHRGTLFVGADVDSQEQWIAGLYGDASASERAAPSDRAPGCTPFSNMMLAGSKSDNSDLHSVIARDMGIGRNAAKVLNYARLYGSGERHSVEELEKSGVKREEAERKARQLFTLTKGDRRQYRQLKKSMNVFFDSFLEEAKKTEKNGEEEDAHLFISGCYFLPDYGEKGCKLTLAFEEWIVMEFVRRTREEGSVPSSSDLLRVLPSLYEDESMTGLLRLYSGGYESDTFNFLELASTRNEIRTPVLGARLGSSLSPLPEDTPDRERFAAKYKRSVINWMVQSSAVDFLHLLLVCLEHLAKEYSIDARFSISIHDEVRYVVAEQDADRFALALMFANMYVRAFISQRVGIHQLPMSCAFFSQVDVDSVLRKEVDGRSVNPDGSIVESGRAMTISDVIKATGGSLEKK